MANLDKVAPPIKQLNQVASQLKNSTLFYAPIKTGNLKRLINASNRPAEMYKITTIGNQTRFTFQLNFAPQGAEYGKFWQLSTLSPTIKNAKTKNVPDSIDFAKKGVNDTSVKTEFQRLIGDYTKDLQKKTIEDTINKSFQKLSSIK